MGPKKQSQFLYTNGIARAYPGFDWGKNARNLEFFMLCIHAIPSREKLWLDLSVFAQNGTVRSIYKHSALALTCILKSNFMTMMIVSCMNLYFLFSDQFVKKWEWFCRVYWPFLMWDDGLGDLYKIIGWATFPSKRQFEHIPIEHIFVPACKSLRKIHFFHIFVLFKL